MQLARAAHLGAHRDVVLTHQDAGVGGPRDLVENGRHAAAGGRNRPRLTARLRPAGQSRISGARTGNHGTHGNLTQEGTAIAKDVWMAGIGLGLVLDDLTERFGGS